ncbi:MAG: CAP domain-containing protein, partial [Actinomycetota bacterium]|nr:CAP domain-containing protein [Actinomycetota bacterium]
MSRRSLIVGVVAALVAGAVLTVAPANALTNCTVSAGEVGNDAEELDLLSRVNEYRTANGRQPLSVDTGLNRAAAWFSRDMADKSYFPGNHVDSLGRVLGARIEGCGVQFRTAGENIAAGNATGAATFEQWRDSPGHNANMLKSDFTRAGVARAFNGASTYGWYWTLD